MCRLFLAAVIPALAVAACGGSGGGGGDGLGEATRLVEDAETDCIYQLRDDITGEVEELGAIPNTFYLGGYFETGGGLIVAALDTQDPDIDASIIVPPCKRKETLELIDAVQASDRQQALDSVPFEDRVYP